MTSYEELMREQREHDEEQNKRVKIGPGEQADLHFVNDGTDPVVKVEEVDDTYQKGKKKLIYRFSVINMSSRSDTVKEYIASQAFAKGPLKDAFSQKTFDITVMNPGGNSMAKAKPSDKHYEGEE